MIKLGKRALTDICKAFCDTLEQNGFYACIYTNPNWLKNYLYADELLSKYDLWLADWYKDKPSYSCGIWQFSDKGSVYGINGNVDMNLSYKNYPQIIKEKGLNGFEKNSSSDEKNDQSYISYSVKIGDSLWSIAEKLLGSGNRYQEIKSINNLSSDTIFPGQILKIPLNEQQDYKTHIVKMGDTLWNIAEKYYGNGSKYKDIKKINGLDSDTIYVGQVLKI